VVDTVNKMFVRLDKTVFTDQNFSNLTVAISSLRLASEKAVTMIEGVDRLVNTNSPRLPLP